MMYPTRMDRLVPVHVTSVIDGVSVNAGAEDPLTKPTASTINGVATAETVTDCAAGLPLVNSLFHVLQMTDAMAELGLKIRMTFRSRALENAGLVPRSPAVNTL